jgi:hypothetical protein
MREKVEREGQEQRKGGGGYVHRLDMISTSFFFTNFAEELVWGDLWKLFASYRSVCDVFIPKKMDKWGRKFGFVKFKGVKDVEALSKDLEEVWWDKHKLRVNRARFEKGDKKEEGSSRKEQVKPVPVPRNDIRVSDENSFNSMLVKGGGAKVDKDGMVVNGEKNRLKTRALNMGDLAPLELQVQPTTMQCLSQSMVGFFKVTIDFQSFMIGCYWRDNMR